MCDGKMPGESCCPWVSQTSVRAESHYFRRCSLISQNKLVYICRCSNTATSPDGLAAAATQLCLRVESAVHQRLHVRNPDSGRPHICAGISLCVLFF